MSRKILTKDQIKRSSEIRKEKKRISDTRWRQKHRVSLNEQGRKHYNKVKGDPVFLKKSREQSIKKFNEIKLIKYLIFN